MATSSSPSAARDLKPIDATPNKENIRLIYLDASIDDVNDSHNTQGLFLELNPAAQFYTDLTKCIAFIKSCQDEQILLVVSGAFAHQLLSQVHNLRSLSAVLILCENDPSDLELRDEYPKIVNIFTDRNSLLLSIEDTLRTVENQLLAFSLFDRKQNSTRDLSKESTSFLWHRLLIDALRKMPHDDQAKRDMVELCSNFYLMNKRESKEIKDFDDSYKPEEAIAWYTKENFLHKLLNRAIRTEDINLLYTFRFFIIDLSEQLENEGKKLKGAGILTLYRGQQIPIEEIQRFRKSFGMLISTNGFFSTSRDVQTSLSFARQFTQKSSMQMCMFVIRADPSLKSVVFADIDRVSQMKGEKEVLFGLNATFKMGRVEMDSALKMYTVQLSTTDEGITHFEKFMKAQEYEMKDYSPLVYFGRILWRDLDQADRAKKYFDMLLKTLPQDHPDMSDVYNEIAPLWSEIGDQELALKNYVKAYEIRQQILQPNDPRISISLNNIGITYAAIGKHDEALEYYYCSLAITKEITPKPNQDWALRLLNIGITRCMKKEYDKALMDLNQAYDIYKQVRPDQHRDIAWCLEAIGNVYLRKGDIDSALYYYYQQLEMQEKCLPLEHLSISKLIDWIANIYVEKGEKETAIAFCQKKLDIQQNNLKENHPRIASTLMTIGKLQGEHRVWYEQALRILENYTPQDKLRTIECLKILSELDFKEDKFEEGLDRWMHILDIRRRIHSPDNPKTASTLEKIGGIYYKYMKNYRAALDYFTESLFIYRANYGLEHRKVTDVDKLISKTEHMLDDGKEDHEHVVKNKKDHLSLPESASDVTVSTTLASFRTPSNNNPHMDKSKSNETSDICVLL